MPSKAQRQTSPVTDPDTINIFMVDVSQIPDILMDDVLPGCDL